MNETVALHGFEDLLNDFNMENFFDCQKFMVDPVSTWSWAQLAVFPWLFIIPAEILGMISSLMIYFGENKLPMAVPEEKRTDLTWTDLRYIWFNRLVMLPFISWLIVTTVWNSNAIVYDMEKLNWQNGLVSFIIVFSLSDLTYYTGHRIVHSCRPIYKFVHKHHHGEGEPVRGWADTCNAHPTDFFYTGFTTSPMSSLWIMPAGSVHIVAIGLCLWINSFVGSLGHCRLDLNWGVFNTRFHAGHHAYSKCNFAQNIELWDRLFGTYRHLKMTKGRASADAQPQVAKKVQ